MDQKWRAISLFHCGEPHSLQKWSIRRGANLRYSFGFQGYSQERGCRCSRSYILLSHVSDPPMTTIRMPKLDHAFRYLPRGSALIPSATAVCTSGNTRPIARPGPCQHLRILLRHKHRFSCANHALGRRSIPQSSSSTAPRAPSKEFARRVDARAHLQTRASAYIHSRLCPVGNHTAPALKPHSVW